MTVRERYGFFFLKEKNRNEVFIDVLVQKLQSEFESKAQQMKQKEEELEAKLIEVNDRLKQQSVIEEYETKIACLENEQLIITQVRSFFFFCHPA